MEDNANMQPTMEKNTTKGACIVVCVVVLFSFATYFSWDDQMGEQRR